MFSPASLAEWLTPVPQVAETEIRNESRERARKRCRTQVLLCASRPCCVHIRCLQFPELLVQEGTHKRNVGAGTGRAVDGSTAHGRE